MLPSLWFLPLTLAGWPFCLLAHRLSSSLKVIIPHPSAQHIPTSTTMAQPQQQAVADSKPPLTAPTPANNETATAEKSPQ